MVGCRKGASVKGSLGVWRVGGICAATAAGGSEGEVRSIGDTTACTLVKLLVCLRPT